MNNLDSIAQNHFFWYAQAAKELQAMLGSAFDLQSNEFILANERFELAMRRARDEYSKFVSLFPNDTTDRSSPEETGNPLL